MNINISTFDQLSLLLKSPNPPTRNVVFIDGLAITRENFISITGKLDPIGLHFNNCNFIGNNCFCSAFCGGYGIYDFSIKNSNLTGEQGKCLIGCFANEYLENLDLSNNHLGSDIEYRGPLIDNRSFLEYFKMQFGYYFTLTSINLTNNGFSKKEKSDFLYYIISHFGDSEFVQL